MPSTWQNWGLDEDLPLFCYYSSLCFACNRSCHTPFLLLFIIVYSFCRLYGFWGRAVSLWFPACLPTLSTILVLGLLFIIHLLNKKGNKWIKASVLYSSLKKKKISTFFAGKIFISILLLTLFKHQPWVPSLPGPSRQFNFWAPLCQWQGAFVNGLGVESTGLGVQSGVGMGGLWSLVRPRNFSRTGRLSHLKNLSFSISGQHRGKWKCNIKISYVLIHGSSPWALNVHSNHLALRICCHDFSVWMCVYVATQLGRLKVHLQWNLFVSLGFSF